MVIGAVGFGPQLTARQTLGRARQFIAGLEAVSPWGRPFDVSGVTAECGNMPIAADLSDFDDVVMTTFGSIRNIKYKNVNDPHDSHLTLDSTSPIGFRVSLSDYIQKKKQDETVSVSLSTPGFPPLIITGAGVEVRAFQPGEINASWSEPTTVEAIFDYLIDFCDATYCVVYGSHQASRNRKFSNGNNLGWLTYFRNQRLQAMLAEDRRARPYRDGTLLKLGDNASMLTDPGADIEIQEICQRLLASGVKDWTRL